MALPRGSIIGSILSNDALAALQLFAGEVKFGSPARIAALASMFPDKASLGAVRDCSFFRGTAAQFNRSDLDDMSRKLADAYDPPELLDSLVLVATQGRSSGVKRKRSGQK
jgi:hypothetical protein